MNHIWFEGKKEILTWASCVDILSIEEVSWSIFVACRTSIYDDMKIGILVGMDEGLGDVTVAVVIISEK